MSVSTLSYNLGSPYLVHTMILEETCAPVMRDSALTNYGQTCRSIHLYTLSRLRANHFLLVLLNAAFLVKEATNTNFIVYGLTRAKIRRTHDLPHSRRARHPLQPQICGLFSFEVEYFHIKIKVIRDQHSIHNSILLYNYKHQRKSKEQSSMYSRHQQHWAHETQYELTKCTHNRKLKR